MSQRGHPDYGQRQAQEIISPVSDLGELAARLGSIVTYERSGNVLFLDDFDDGLAAWFPQWAGTGAGVATESTYVYQGAQSVKLTTGTDSWQRAGLLKRFQPVSLGKVGVEVKISIPDPIEAILFGIQQNDGTERWRYHLWIEPDDNQFSIRDDDNYPPGKTKVDDHLLPSGDGYLFHTLKLVVDLKNKAYVRFLLDQSEYNLSDYTVLNTSPDVSDPRIEVLVEVRGRAANNDVGYVDDFILTFNEP